MSGVRADKWLWAARFFKTRGLAVEAISGGRVHVNGQRIKPAKEIAVGDELEISIGQSRFVVTVRGTAERRGPATEAQKLYEETEESRRARDIQAAQRRLAAPPGAELSGRPTKRDRRRFDASRGHGRGRGRG